MSRRSSPSPAGRQLSCRSRAGCQGPVQELRAAIRPSWRRRQLRTAEGAVASSACIPFVTAVSAVNPGSKMNARSFLAPSPLISDRTSGVKGTPEVKLPIALTSSARVTGSVTVPTNA